MSYGGDDYDRRGGNDGGYGGDRQGSGRNDKSEYGDGGGGRSSDDRYDQSQRNDDNDNRRGDGRQRGGQYDDDQGGRQGGGYGGGRSDEYSGGQGGSRDDGYSGGQGGGYEGNQGRRQHGGGGNDYDDDEVLNTAQKHGGNGDSSLFSQALGFLKQSGGGNDDVDEDRMKQSHNQLYQNGGDQPHDSQSIGAGAAMQALKMFSGGGGSSGGGGQSQMIGMAMSEASKLFDQQNNAGNVQSGADKQSAVNQAAKMALQMYMKSQGGGAGGLMSMASKFF